RDPGARVLRQLRALVAAEDDLLEAAVRDLILGRPLEEAGQSLPGVVRSKGLLGQLDQARDAVLEELLDQPALVGKAPVGGADADARVMGNLIESDRQPLGGEQLGSRLEDAPAVALGVGAERLLGGHERSLAETGDTVSILC